MSSIHEAAFQSQPEEHAFVAKGVAPGALRGTFLRTGPGLLRVGADDLNFFDGHALICGLSFDDGRCTFRSRFVRTPVYEEETRSGRMTKRRLVTNLPSRWSNLFALDLGNTAMHDVYAWGGKIVAGADPGHFALDPKTLATIGPERWSGAVSKGWETSPMPYADPRSGHLVGWLKKQGGLRPDALKMVELDDRFRVVTESTLHSLGASPAFIHDHRATERWYVLMELPARLSVARALWGAQPIFEAFSWPAGKTADLVFLPRGREGGPVRVPMPGVVIAFHVLNAFDDGAHTIVDAVTYDGVIRFTAAAARSHRERLGVAVRSGPRPVPRRYVVDVANGRIVSQRDLGDLPLEAPEVADASMGKPYRFAYGSSRPSATCPDAGAYFLYSGIVKVDVESGATTSWFAGEQALASPPSFVPRPGGADEDDGWLLTWVLEPEGGGASVVVLDAKDPSRDPVARIELGVHLPAVSHVRFAPDVQLTA
ncbi:MAG: carotenoid oxygenase family protein [Deltaproteobacteria bacterium]|nr:carotenoid oxygenase family protein [Deltaproteobacteria bacterium]